MKEAVTLEKIAESTNYLRNPTTEFFEKRKNCHRLGESRAVGCVGQEGILTKVLC